MTVESWMIHATFISHPLYLGHMEYGGRQVRTFRKVRAWSGPWWRCLLDTSGHCTNEWRTAVTTCTRGRQHHDSQNFSINAGVLMMIPPSSEIVESWWWLGERSQFSQMCDLWLGTSSGWPYSHIVETTLIGHIVQFINKKKAWYFRDMYDKRLQGREKLEMRTGYYQNTLYTCWNSQRLNK